MFSSKSILIPLDFSDCSFNALKYAIDISFTNIAKLILLNITDSNNSEAEFKQKLVNFQNRFNIDLLSQLEKVKHEYVFRSGNVNKEIIKVREASKADLIVMGTQGAHNLNRKLFGTNTIEVMQKADCAVLAVPAESIYCGIKKVVLATDMHRKNLRMIESAFELIRSFNPELMLLYVSDKTDPKTQVEYALSEIPNEVKKYIDYLNTTMHVSSFKNINEGIHHFVERKNADLLIMITEHRSLYKSLVDKSETKKMAYQSMVPLLSVPNSID